jgi:hypothetical protein
MEYENSFTFKLEHLIADPKIVLENLYTHCGLDPARTKFNEHLKPNKFFNYKKKGFCIDENPKVKNMKDEYWKIMNDKLPNLLEIMNQVDGPSYEL